MWELMRYEYNEETMLEGCELLENCSWSSTVTEQAHVFASVVVRAHKHCGEPVMRSRSMVVATKPLLVKDVFEQRVLKLRERIQRLRLRRPQNISGRHMFVSHLAANSAVIPLRPD